MGTIFDPPVVANIIWALCMSCPTQYPPPAPGDDDLYSGFGKEDVAPALATHDLEYDPAFQVLKTCSNLKDPAHEI